MKRIRLCFNKNHSLLSKKTKSWHRELMKYTKKTEILASACKNVKVSFDNLISRSSWRKRRKRRKSKLSKTTIRKNSLKQRIRKKWQQWISLWLMNMKNSKLNGITRDNSYKNRLLSSKNKMKRTRQCMRLLCKQLIKEVAWLARMRNRSFR